MNVKNIADFTKGATPMGRLKDMREATSVERRFILRRYCRSKVFFLILEAVLFVIYIFLLVHSMSVGSDRLLIAFQGFLLGALTASTVHTVFGIVERYRYSYMAVTCKVSKIDNYNHCVWVETEGGELVDSWFIVSEDVLSAGKNGERLLLIYGLSDGDYRRTYGSVLTTMEKVGV